MESEAAVVGNEEAEVAEEEEEEEGDDFPEIENPSGPRSVLKVNPTLDHTLEKPVNLRASHFDSRRSLAFEALE